MSGVKVQSRFTRIAHSSIGPGAMAPGSDAIATRHERRCGEWRRL